MTNPALNIRIAEAKGWTEVVPPRNGRGCGIPPGRKLPDNIPDYTGDPREWGPLLEEMRKRYKVDIDCHHTGYAVRIVECEVLAIEPDLGHAVCLAWLAVNEAEEGGR